MKEDLKQYITNLLYAAYAEGNKFNAPKPGCYNPSFDKWVEEQVDNIDEYFKTELVV